MSKIIAAALFLICLTCNVAAQNNSAVLPDVLPENFKTDGCTLFPDGDYRDCCVVHDLAYFHGGTRRGRLRADNVLFRCVKNKKGWWHKIIAPMMWVGVRIGGVSFLPTSFRWGFGGKFKNNSNVKTAANANQPPRPKKIKNVAKPQKIKPPEN